MLSLESLKQIDVELAKYPAERRRSAIMSALRIAQTELGWLSTDTIAYVADYVKIPATQAMEVATFYGMYNLKPVGKYVFEVCQTGPCMISGSDSIIDYTKQVLSIQPGETTKDGLFTLKLVECLGACGYAPMMQVGKIYKEHLTKEKVDAIIAEYRQAANKN